ncbi:putative nuclease HARBI1 [Haliotis rubra]|uniref:putative nuclease HARBI1 n=1 Tax=Haliotis rubra TaxID=36100 RepID=UPI001EE619AE|nr:putative nuclease HARBI1 [Haliotis rubra]
MEGNNLPAGAHLLGDSGYPSKRWLLTPYLRPQPGHKTNYNRSHKRTRSSVERGFGQLKRRFSVLHGEMRLSPERACKVITACAVLHNICKTRDIPLPYLDGNHRVNPPPQNGQLVLPAQGIMGVRYREQFAITNFP